MIGLFFFIFYFLKLNGPWTLTSIAWGYICLFTIIIIIILLFYYNWGVGGGVANLLIAIKGVGCHVGPH